MFQVRVLIGCQCEIHLCAEGHAQSLSNPFFQKLAEDPSSAQPLFFPYACLCEKTMEVCHWFQWQQNSDNFWTSSPLKLFLQNVATGSNHLPFSVLIQVVQRNHTENHVSSTQKIKKILEVLSGNLFLLSGSFRLDPVLMWKFKQIFLSAEKNASRDERHVWCMLLTLFLCAPIFCVRSTQLDDLAILSSDFQLAAVCKIMPCQDYLYCRYGMMKAGSVKKIS